MMYQRLISVCAAWSLLSVSAATAEQRNEGANAVITGLVVYLDSNEPVIGAQVRAVSTEAAIMAQALTDENGVYRLRVVGAKRYSVAASKPGLYQVTSGRAAVAFLPFYLNAGENYVHHPLPLTRGAAIEGTVFSDRGQPMVDMQLTAMRVSGVLPEKRLVVVTRSFATDDLGHFRLFGLSPGTYVVSVASPTPAGFQSNSRMQSLFAPGVVSLGEAATFVITASETQRTDIVYRSVPRSRLSGRVWRFDGEPAASGSIVLERLDPSGVIVDSAREQIREDGTFEVESLPAGSYHLTATSGNDIGDSYVNVSGEAGTVEFTTRPHVRLRGRVVTRGRAGAVMPSRAIRLGTEDLDGLNRSSVSVAVNSDYSFDFAIPAGRVRLIPKTTLLGWEVTRILVGNIEIDDSGIDANAGAQGLENVVVELSSDLPVLNGTVDIDNSPFVTVVAFPTTVDLSTVRSSMIRAERTDASGKFSLRLNGLGAYYLVAVPAAFDPSSGSRELLQDRLGFAKVVDVRSDVTTVTLSKPQ